MPPSLHTHRVLCFANYRVIGLGFGSISFDPVFSIFTMCFIASLVIAAAMPPYRLCLAWWVPAALSKDWRLTPQATPTLHCFNFSILKARLGEPLLSFCFLSFLARNRPLNPKTSAEVRKARHFHRGAKGVAAQLCAK